MKFLRSFLDDLKLPEGCLLICHDENHNGPGGCGDPACWKHVPGQSPPPKNYRPPNCRCPQGTFPGDATVAGIRANVRRPAGW
jgi:hypothetical protein